MLVETWPNGPGKLNSSCQRTYHILNIDSIDFKTNLDTSFTTRHDHSKWAVSADMKNLSNQSGLRDKLKYVCIGDINRMATQYKRGGGTVCFRNQHVWRAFRDLVSSFEACPRHIQRYFELGKLYVFCCIWQQRPKAIEYPDTETACLYFCNYVKGW